MQIRHVWSDLCRPLPHPRTFEADDVFVCLLMGLSKNVDDFYISPQVVPVDFALLTL